MLYMHYSVGQYITLNIYASYISMLYIL